MKRKAKAAVSYTIITLILAILALIILSLTLL